MLVHRTLALASLRGMDPRFTEQFIEGIQTPPSTPQLLNSSTAYEGLPTEARP